MDKAKIVKELGDLNRNELGNPFPYRDIDRIQENFIDDFSLLNEESCFTADFNDYCMTIAGIISYVLNGNTDKIPHQQANLIRMNFFDRFPIYRFLEHSVADYSTFNDENRSFEKARKMLLEFLG
jgi:hypothetical protein